MKLCGQKKETGEEFTFIDTTSAWRHVTGKLLWASNNPIEHKGC